MKVWARTTYQEEYEVEADDLKDAARQLKTGKATRVSRRLLEQHFGPMSDSEMTALRNHNGFLAIHRTKPKEH